MMKVFVVLLGLSLGPLSWAQEALPGCTIKNAKPVIKKAKAHTKHDKRLHCSVSCMLSLRCNPAEVYVVGLLKEFRDLLGYGTPDAADIQANKVGIDLAVKGHAHDDKECLQGCDEHYPKKNSRKEDL